MKRILFRVVIPGVLALWLAAGPACTNRQQNRTQDVPGKTAAQSSKSFSHCAPAGYVLCGESLTAGMLKNMFEINHRTLEIKR